MTNGQWMIENGHKFSDLRLSTVPTEPCTYRIYLKDVGEVGQIHDDAFCGVRGNVILGQWLDTERDSISWDDIYKKVKSKTTTEDIIQQMEATRKKYRADYIGVSLTTGNKVINFSISEESNE